MPTRSGSNPRRPKSASQGGEASPTHEQRSSYSLLLKRILPAARSDGQRPPRIVQLEQVSQRCDAEELRAAREKAGRFALRNETSARGRFSKKENRRASARPEVEDG